MPRKAMKAIVEVDIHAITCPGTFLRDYEYVYLHMEMMGLEARTKSVPPTFPFFLHERLKFERTFHNSTDPDVISAFLRGEDCIMELRQHTDYIGEGKTIAHCSSNTYDFLYPAIPPHYGTGREILLYKTSKFKPIRVTGEPVKLEFSTKTTIKEIPDYSSPAISDSEEEAATEKRPASRSGSRQGRSMNRSLNGSMNRSASRGRSLSRTRSQSPRRSLAETTHSLTNDTMNQNETEFVIKRKDDNMLSNRDFGTFDNPPPRRSSPSRKRSPTRTLSPTRRGSGHASSSRHRDLGRSTVESLPSFHTRSATTPIPRPISPSRAELNRSIARHEAELELSKAKARLRRSLEAENLELSRSRLRRSLEADNLRRSLRNLTVYDSESDVESLDALRNSLRAERSALNEAIREADRKAFYRSTLR